jgi:hypothetical protein
MKPLRHDDDPAARADLSPEAATDAMRLAVECMTQAGGQLRAGRLAQASLACHRAQRALEAACISLNYLLGGLPR